MTTGGWGNKLKTYEGVQDSYKLSHRAFPSDTSHILTRIVDETAKPFYETNLSVDDQRRIRKALKLRKYFLYQICTLPHL